MTGIRSLALRLALAAALGAPFAAGAGAQWGWMTPASPAPQAQAPAPQGENFSAGKSGAQLFASDCTGAGCHKGPQGLAKDRGAGSLASFLREHYTNSRQSAAALAAYLVGVAGPSRGEPRQPRAATRSDEKPPERKPPAAIPSAPATPSGETGEPAKPPPRAQRGRQATVPAPQPAAPAPAPAATPAPPPEPPPAPAAPPEPPKPQWDIFD